MRHFFEKIYSLFSTDYIIGSPKCDQAFSIFCAVGWTICIIAIIYVLIILVKGKDIEGRIIEKDSRKDR